MKQNKSLRSVSKSLHRDFGYLFIGVTIFYTFTGFVLSVRNLDWFKKDYIFQTNISKNVEAREFKEKIVKELTEGTFDIIYNPTTKNSVKGAIRKLEFIKKENRLFYFEYRTLKIKYNQSNGKTDVMYRGFPTFLQKLINAHLASTNKIWFYMAVIYSVVLTFFAFSAVVIVTGKYGFKKRGFLFMMIGFVVMVVFLFLD